MLESLSSIFWERSTVIESCSSTFEKSTLSDSILSIFKKIDKSDSIFSTIESIFWSPKTSNLIFRKERQDWFVHDSSELILKKRAIRKKKINFRLF